jgi:hypothetical protein
MSAANDLADSEVFFAISEEREHARMPDVCNQSSKSFCDPIAPTYEAHCAFAMGGSQVRVMDMQSDLTSCEHPN